MSDIDTLSDLEIEQVTGALSICPVRPPIMIKPWKPIYRIPRPPVLRA